MKEGGGETGSQQRDAKMVVSNLSLSMTGFETVSKEVDKVGEREENKRTRSRKEEQKEHGREG